MRAGLQVAVIINHVPARIGNVVKIVTYDDAVRWVAQAVG